ncbi:Solute carrier family 35 member G1 [Holothuria leucospilota]|uniref:Solute carrier family 35 member G1 n=1 Tax=Holothuria leucospilota TaxID=206669 RepID=A0A9Q1CDJ3_HOLLE|nr:Solute carrier family 35 member G1 [Holothuria leucospilota]
MVLWFRRLYRRRGLLYAFLSALLLTVTDLFVKMIIDHMNPLQLTAMRKVIFFMCCTSNLFFRAEGRYFKHDTKKEYKLLLVRCIFATGSTVFIVFAYRYADMGSVTAIFNSMPVFSGILGRVILEERFTIVEVMLSVVSIGGVFLVAQPPFVFRGETSRNATEGEHFLGAILAFTSAIVTAVSLVLSRLLSKRNVHNAVIMFYYAFIAAILCTSLTTLLHWWSVPACGWHRILLIAIGILNFVVQALLVEALKLEKPVSVTVILTLNIFFAFLFQFIFLAEVPNILSVTGALVVFIASIGMALHKFAKAEESQTMKGGTSSDQNEVNLEILEAK